MTHDTWIILLYAICGLGALALGWALGTYGSAKGYPFFLCFMLGILTTPMVGWIIIALLPEREQKYKPPAELLLAIELEKAKMKAEQEAAV